MCATACLPGARAGSGECALGGEAAGDERRDLRGRGCDCLGFLPPALGRVGQRLELIDREDCLADTPDAFDRDVISALAFRVGTDCSLAGTEGERTEDTFSICTAC